LLLHEFQRDRVTAFEELANTVIGRYRKWTGVGSMSALASKQTPEFIAGATEKGDL